MSPFRFKAQLDDIKTLTPEEYEVILGSYEEFKVNAKLYSSCFCAMGLGFVYWQRRFVPRSFFLLGGSLGLFAGVSYAAIRTGWYFVEQVDMLGKDYVISRMIKQDIFDSRPDIDSGTRAQYYMYQNQ